MILHDYYEMLISGDTSRFDERIDSSFYGVRMYDETTIYERSKLLEYIHNNPIQEVEITSVRSDGDTYHYDMVLTDEMADHACVAKAEVKDGRIVKLYETIRTDKLRIVCECAYDGSSFYGYQRQPKHHTVQQTIEEAVTKALQLNDDVTIHASGRTDRGVHALKQVFHFDVDTVIPIDKMRMVINSHLPDSIHVHALKAVEPTFHSRYDVKAKEYRYKINTGRYNPIQRNYEWHTTIADMERLRSELAMAIGTHDFRTFTTAGDVEQSVRTIHTIRIVEDGEHVWIAIRGDGFLRYMVRYLVGAAVAIANSHLDMTMSDLLEAQDVDLLKDKAPATGLYLYDVTY